MALPVAPHYGLLGLTPAMGLATKGDSSFTRPARTVVDFPSGPPHLRYAWTAPIAVVLPLLQFSQPCGTFLMDSHATLSSHPRHVFSASGSVQHTGYLVHL